ncbi:MAG: hypothetical protein ABWZ99_17950 [Ilumatobacteraceae bacterium]
MHPVGDDDRADAPADDLAPATFAFAFEDRMKPWSRLFRVTPTNSSVTLTDYGLEVRFGRWRLTTPWFNIVSAGTTGPYTMWKVAGPAHLTPSDRGITFATTTRRGVCLDFRDPVRAIDPFGLIHHPNATITVEDPERFVDEIHRRVTAASRRLAPVPTPRPPRGTIPRSLSAITRWIRRDRSVAVRAKDVDELFVPDAADDHGLADGQPISSGTGAWFHRRYFVRVVRPTMGPVAAMAELRSDLNVLVDEEMAPFTKSLGVHGQLDVGDRYIVETAGPWNGPVEVTEATPHSFRLATLDGHMEAGMIEFAVAGSDDELQFTIESWNRSAGRTMDALYDHLPVAKDLQSEMWVGACERFAGMVGGHRVGPVEVETERAADSAMA